MPTGRANAAREIELARDQVIPDAFACRAHRLVAGRGGDIRHARIHVDGPHCVAHRLALFDHLQVRLVVIEAARVGALALGERAGAAFVEQELGELEIAGVGGDAVQLHQGHLGDLVSRPGRAPAGTERPHEEVGGLDRHVEQRALAGGEMMRHRRFEEVAEIVELVTVVTLEHPPLGTGPAMRVLRIDRPRRVDIAVGFLRGGDLCDQTIDVGVKLWIRRDAQ
jgi:hypothetical protein